MNLDNVQHPEPLLVPPPPIAQPDPDSAIPAGTTWGQLFAALNVMVVNTVTNTVSVAIPNAVTAALNAALPAAVNAAVTAAITTAVIAPYRPANYNGKSRTAAQSPQGGQTADYGHLQWIFGETTPPVAQPL